jgi:hypothetical protein
MSDFDLWLREAYASTWVDWSPEALMLGRAAFDSQAAQLLDAKRSEERASAERLKDRERLTKTLRLDASHGPMPASMEFILASIDAVVRQAAGPVARLMSEPMVQCETTRLRAKLHTLEAAVRAVRNGDWRGVAMNFYTLDKLYALVPEVGA